MTGSDTPGVRRAWGWLAHLRDGGTVPWQDWSGSGPDGGLVLPGAQQLELLRRLNEAGPVPPDLAERVLEASAPGRGRPDLELVDVVERRPFGPPPVDPSDLPDDELLRVAVGLLAEDVVADGPPEPARTRTPRPWRARYRLVGDPVLAGPRRADLVGRGLPPGRRGSVVYVLATDAAQLTVDAWTARSLSYGAPPWPEFVAAARRRGGLPPAVDPLRVAERWARDLGPARVRVVLDLDALPRLLRVRRPLAAAPALSADAVDLARRTGQVLGLLVVPPQRQALLHDVLVPRLVRHPGPALVLPQRHLRWVRRQARHVRDGLLAGGYAVHGDPDGLLPVAHPGVPEPSDAGVLALAMRLLLEKK